MFNLSCHLLDYVRYVSFVLNEGKLVSLVALNTTSSLCVYLFRHISLVVVPDGFRVGLMLAFMYLPQTSFVFAP